MDTCFTQVVERSKTTASLTGFAEVLSRQAKTVFQAPPQLHSYRIKRGLVTGSRKFIRHGGEFGASIAVSRPRHDEET